MGKGGNGSLAGNVKKAFKELRDEALDFVAEGKEAVGYKSKEEQYRDNLEANYSRVSDILDRAEQNFISACKTGDFDKAFQAFIKTVKVCVLAMKIAVVDTAEKLGLNEALRDKGKLEKSPINIMKDFERKLDDLEPSLKEAAKEAAKDIKQFAKDVKKQAKEAARNL